ncbi:hypothetical protein P171DRAFT_487196 [Karstenula rhodostoma CBS 690.94]|uniref:Zn(2)-C6 fungal-type domain-containing protein n=1 Tax=Karstenula rhodostoma CBS 690.94 TaxID=1392251 RepID=A0A9P4PHZ7_9PLEO|nr:hypothetical protein P171DRAFT_487196 [Karstenula rhodostoma CBS 690.94]
MRTTTETHQQPVAPMNSIVPTTQARLRNSCDACNTAKVKCSKERPCCRRCQRKELFCVYSVSLRCSKRPVDNRSASTTKKPSGVNSTPNARPKNPINNEPSMSRLPPLSTGLEGGLDATLDSAISTSLYDFDSLSALSDVNFDLHNLDDYFSTDAYLPPTNFSVYANTTASTPPAPHKSLSRPPAQLCGCQQHILSKLSELSLSSSGSAPVPFDRALSENRAILAICTSTLSCPTCARSPDTTLLLTLSALLAHALHVFESLFPPCIPHSAPRDPTSSPPDTASSTRSSETNFNMFNTGLELMTPPASVHGSRPNPTTSPGLSTPPAVRLSLGSYELDDRDSHLLRTSLLQMELGKISACVEAFEARLAGGKLLRHLGAFLRLGLGACCEGVKRLGAV